MQPAILKLSIEYTMIGHLYAQLSENEDIY